MELNPVVKTLVNNPIFGFILSNFLLPNVFKLIRQTPERALEIGCGIGATTKELVGRFPNMKLTAIDYDFSQVKKAKENLSSVPNINVEQADATQLPFVAETFDAVFLFDTLHHIANFEDALKEISRVLKIGGCFYIMDVSKKFFNPLFKLIDQPEALFTREEVKNGAQKYNLMCETMKGGKIFYAVFRKI